ncbi:hypothetical protein ACP70R_013653 [Stipagrostis hirtigluma subsp. patula]
MPLKLLMEAKDVQSHDGDRISRLRDDIILAILEKVSICTVIRTSILSTRWRHLPLLLSHIYLEAEDFMPQNTEVADFRLIDEAMSALVGLLCSFLDASTTESTIRTLSLRVGLIADRLCDIGKLVCSAIDSGKLKNLELEIPTVKDPLESDDKDRQEHAQSLICLFESYPRMFCYLTKLDLYNASFRETDMLHLLNSCEQLQNLILNECDTGIWIEPEGEELRNSFRALRKLFLHGIYVEFDLLWTLLLLEAAPSIQIFGIQIWDHTCGENNRALYSERTIGAWDAKKLGGSTACLQLKALEMRGFKQVKEHLDFIRAVMERAPNLETLLLEGKEYCKGCEATDYSVCSSLMSMFPMNKDEEDIVVKQIRADGLNHPVRIIFRRPL